MDDGELFLEYSQSESVALDDGRIKSAAFDTTQGFGLRAVAGEAAGYAHASELSEPAMRRAAAAVRAVATGHAGTLAAPPSGTNRTPLHRAEPARHRRSRRPRRSCWPRSTPMRAAATRACARSWPRCPGSGRRCRSCAPTARRAADIRPLVRLNVVDRRRRRRPHGDRLARRRRPGHLRALPRPGKLEGAGRRGVAPGADQSRLGAGAGRRDDRRARTRAGPASCCTRRSAMGSKAISTARRPRPSPAWSASRSRPRA